MSFVSHQDDFNESRTSLCRDLNLRDSGEVSRVPLVAEIVRQYNHFDSPLRDRAEVRAMFSLSIILLPLFFQYQYRKENTFM